MYTQCVYNYNQWVSVNNFKTHYSYLNRYSSTIHKIATPKTPKKAYNKAELDKKNTTY